MNCGSELHKEQIANSQSQASKPTSQKLLQWQQTPQWLRALVGTFLIYVLSVAVYEYIKSPSGGVEQRATGAMVEQPHDHDLLEQIKELEKQTMADPKNADAMLQFANVLHDAKFFPRAIEMYKKYLILNPQNNDARVDLGICYYETDDYAQAVKEIEAVIKKDSKHQMAMFNLGVIHLSQKNIPESQKWLKKAIELDPQSTAGLRAQQILQQHQ